MKNLKRALSLVLSAAMMVGMMVVGTSAAELKDVKGHENQQAAELMAMIGVMEGDGENFNPDKVVTRNEMAVVICNLMNLKLNGFHNFTDVPEWADKYVGAMYANGLTSGTSATTYGGAADVTTVEAALMVMKTLGYFEYQGEFEGDWKLATIKKATELKLFKDVDAGVNDGLTRGEVAQMVMNALQMPVVNAHEQGGMNVSGDGFTVTEKATYTYPTAYKSLMFKLYEDKLVKNGADFDDYGRPAAKWTFTGNGKIETLVVAEAADIVFTAETKEADVKKATKGYTYAASSNAAVALLTGNGVRVELFADEDMVIDEIIVIDEFYAKVLSVTKADEAKDTKRFVKIDKNSPNNTFETENFAKDDIVIYTVGDDTKVKTMELAEKLTGKVTAVPADGSYIKIDGVTYKYHDGFAETKPALDSTMELYLDSYGYIIHVGKEVKSVASVDQYVVVTAKGNDGFAATGTYNQFKVLKADGTTAVVSAEQKGSSVAVASIAPNTLYTMKDSDGDGKYEFATATAAQDSATQKYAGYDIAIENVALNADKDKLVNGYTLAETAVIFNYNSGKNEWSVTTGAKLANAASANVVLGYANKNDAGFYAVELATATSDLSSTSDFIYGYITAKPEKVKNADGNDVISVTYWNGEENVTVLTDDDTTVVAKGEYIQFKMNEKGEMIDEAGLTAPANGSTGTGYISAFDGKVINFNGNTANIYDVDADTVVIYVDSDSDVVAGVAEGNIALASKDEAGNYVNNAKYIIDKDNDVVVLFVDINGKIQ